MTLKIIGVMAILMMAMSGAFYWYYTDAQERIAILNKNVATLEIAEQIAQEAINSMIQYQIEVNVELTKLNKEFKIIRNQNAMLAKKLSEHNVGVLAAAKPGLVEKIINRASDKATRCFELLSGAELTPAEQNATSGREFNSECPWLWNN